ncbi:MAG: hypothetical protein WAN92_05150 [Herbaspirillum sp.]
MGNRLEFHGNVGQVIVGNLHEAPTRSGNVYTIGNDVQRERWRASNAVGTGRPDGCAEQAKQIRQARWMLGVQTVMIAALAGWLLFSQYASADADIYCLSDGKRHSIGSTVMMAGDPMTCARDVNAGMPMWWHATANFQRSVPDAR